ncbi:metabotropic glutamate receptor 2-like [Mya arenaria]|uniref:metabotropic glutamate receptor 2-like n=1 Tax=Mya arenaria TaxID=6604 RepID=UPI0022DF66F0|nr:metabotropic glutamate receptor 2-like [Mya arenaria]
MGVTIPFRQSLVVIPLLTALLLGFPQDVFQPKYRWIEEGDVNIGAILSIHSSISLFNCTDTIQDARKIQNVEALNFAVQEINKRSDILPNISLGFVILDDCLSPSIALARAMQFMPRDMREDEAHDEDSRRHGDQRVFYDVVGVIGTYTSKLSIIVSNVLNLFELPQISHTATSDVLSDKSRFPYFFRMVPPDKYQAKAITSVLHWFDWSHVAIVYSEGNYGRDGVKELRHIFQTIKSGICIEDAIEINYGSKDTDILQILERLNGLVDTRVVVAFVEIEDAISIVHAVQIANLTGRFIWVGSDSFNLVMTEKHNYCNTFSGSLFVHPFAQNIDRFGKHLASLHSESNRNPWIHELDINMLDSNETKSTKAHSVWNQMTDKGNMQPSFVDSFLIDSVYAFAHALDNVINKNCSNDSITISDVSECISRIGIFKELKTISFNGSLGEIEFNAYGDVKTKYAVQQCFNDSNSLPDGVVLRTVGYWDMTGEELFLYTEKLMWSAERSPFSACPRPCTEIQGTIYYFMKQTCCHVCITCKMNEIVTANATRCEICPSLYWPDDSRQACLPIPPIFFGLQNAVSICLCTVAILGVVTCIWVTATLVRYHEEHVIKCFSVELSGIILLGTLMTYGLTGSFLSRPNTLKCYINHIGFSLAFTVIYAPLLVKTNRIYRIFSAGRRTNRKPCFISTSSQVVIAVSLIICQVAIVIIGTSLEPPVVALQMPLRTERLVELSCTLPQVGLLASLSFNLVLVIITTFYAFKTRKLPQNYKESRYIAFCVDTTLLIWVTFVPTYFTTSRAAAKTTILAVALLLNASVTVSCLFIPRIYSLYRSLQDKSGTGHNYNDFKIVKHVVKRKQSRDLMSSDYRRDALHGHLGSVPSALTVTSDVFTSPHQPRTYTPHRDNTANSLELTDLEETIS